MQRIEGVLLAAALLIGFAFIAAMLIVGAAYLIAFVAPLFGFFYLLYKLTVARQYWQSHGRFQLPDAIRIISENRARGLAGLEALEGFGGFVLTWAAPALLFGRRSLIVAVFLFLLGATVQTVARNWRRRVIAHAEPVDLMPPR